jgi:predicted hotdog family 3-hydroxylacyl-ACP dehydratase
LVVTRTEIGRLIPHGGAMSLLDGVLRWDAETIRCVARTHTRADNPLRAHGRLPAMCGIEYAAQAMAVHGGLSGILAARPKLGFIASVRDVSCLVDRLDEGDGDLVIDAEKVASNDLSVLYRFSLDLQTARGTVRAVQGSAAVLLDGGGLA